MIHDTKVTLLLVSVGVLVAAWFGTGDVRGLLGVVGQADTFLEEVTDLRDAIVEHEQMQGCRPATLELLAVADPGRYPSGHVPPCAGLVQAAPLLPPLRWIEPATGALRLPSFPEVGVGWAGRRMDSITFSGLPADLQEIALLECPRVLRTTCERHEPDDGAISVQIFR